MAQTLVNWLLLLLRTVHFGSAIFLHEPSYVRIRPQENATDFGYSITYQKSSPPNLLIGAPHGDQLGQVYRCGEGDILKKEAVCNKIDLGIEKLKDYVESRDYSSNQHFCLGSSIVATSNYFLTCAPLWTAEKKQIRNRKVYSGAYGTCFVYNGTTHRYNGFLEQYDKGKNFYFDSIFGGIGWSTLTDESNDVTIIAKPSVVGDLFRLSSSNPLESTKFMSKKLFKDMNAAMNIGYALASGNFFDNKTYYAFSFLTNRYETNGIAFLTYDSNKKKVAYLKKVAITFDKVGAMFGASLQAADLDLDGLTELMVGAPAESDDDRGYEMGALHIYIGGEMQSVNEERRRRSILGTKDGTRFGTSIASTDIDGDSLPEIFVSAPYEGAGVVYVLSGYEINQELLKYVEYRQIRLTELKLTQRIENVQFHSFGTSLLVIPDLDKNGSNELAIGAPDSTSVILYRSVPSINATVTVQLMGKQIVREQDEKFVVQVCVVVSYPSKPSNITSKLTVISDITGNDAVIAAGQEQFVVDLSVKQPVICDNVTVELSTNEQGSYSFKALVKLDKNYQEIKDFDNRWVTLSPYSETETTLEITRRCSGEDCLPRVLITNMEFSGNKTYILGSTEMENVTVRVRNDGNSSYEACVWMRVSGAPVARAEDCEKKRDGYRCLLPKPLRRNAEHSLKISLDMSKLSNVEKNLIVNVTLHNICNQDGTFISQNLQVPFSLSTEDIEVKGSSQNRNITDKEILDEESTIVTNEHEYLIINNGSVTWKNVKVDLMVDRKPFINTSRVSLPGKYELEFNKDYSEFLSRFVLTFDLMRNSSLKLILTTEIVKGSIVNNLENGKLNISSKFKLLLDPSMDYVYQTITNEITFQKEIKVGQNKSLILLISCLLALLVLAIVVFVLYKYDFFKRKQKTKLDALKQEIRNQSVRRTDSNESRPTRTQSQIENTTNDTQGDSTTSESDRIPI